MRLLLDTHVMIWWALGNPLLKPAARALIADDANTIAVSVVSVWEVAIKSRLSRQQPIDLTAGRFADLAEEAGFALVPVAVRHTLRIEHLPHLHGDPFDRLLIATAEVETYRLVTHDHALAGYGDHVLVV